MHTPYTCIACVTHPSVFSSLLTHECAVAKSDRPIIILRFGDGQPDRVLKREVHSDIPD